MTLAPVRHDAVQPRAEPRRLTAAREVTVGADEALGHRVRGGVPAPEHPGREPQQARFVPTDHDAERFGGAGEPAPVGPGPQRRSSRPSPNRRNRAPTAARDLPRSRGSAPRPWPRGPRDTPRRPAPDPQAARAPASPTRRRGAPRAPARTRAAAAYRAPRGYARRLPSRPSPRSEEH